MPEKKSEKFSGLAWVATIASTVIAALIIFWATHSGGLLYEMQPKPLDNPIVKIGSFNMTSRDILIDWDNEGVQASGDIVVYNAGKAAATQCRVVWITVSSIPSYSTEFMLDKENSTSVHITSPILIVHQIYPMSICVECNNSVKSDCYQTSVKVSAPNTVAHTIPTGIRPTIGPLRTFLPP